MTPPTTTDDLTNRAKRDLIIELLEHVDYDRDLGEGGRGELDKPHLRALLEHAREHLPPADQLLDEADDEVLTATEWGLESLEQCEKIELMLLLGRLVDNGYADRVALTQDGYEVVEGSAGSYRSEELQAIYRVLIEETPAAMGTER
jgi:hypothetical protein